MKEERDYLVGVLKKAGIRSTAEGTACEDHDTACGDCRFQ